MAMADARRRGLPGWALVLALTLAGLAAVQSARADIIDRIVAVVGPDVIMLSDVRAVTTLGLMPDAADDEAVIAQLIDRALILAEVNRFIVPEPGIDLITSDIADVRRRFPTLEALAAALATVGLTEAGLARVVRDNRRIDSYLSQRFGSTVQPTEAELAQFYRERASRYSVGAALQSFDQVREQVRRDLQEERRQALIADWVSRLRARVAITRP
ncbi:MAG: hypothetical protein QGG24_07320 [Vicinamibacterales bacterium]|jgi:hypothetical protein|nr:hypothetical protein [Acidobacteriota bacterium]MDP7295115.1 hypothetical protein [Vicinamibacterales bacterium]MDP7472249.1 hypothetical protein [Vicinamibacterales bacterium]MDP7670590.1 hypothetical protein [Vicinamibacterales bacterium]HJO39127.1 hypothetical protein [Vicinamibacterales bacterium]|tara:strand:- start:5591 stop:6235 length:645 start_codon:yes stop_codon:yes gene_type:complete